MTHNERANQKYLFPRYFGAKEKVQGRRRLLITWWHRRLHAHGEAGKSTCCIGRENWKCLNRVNTKAAI